ncbi:MAG: hypothetical protein J6Y32_00375 [Bacteroidales bacterium]|nr:hypothetical protein [Bacteroidales bacterium]
MKKIFSILAVVVLAIATVSLTSCQKDIDKAKSLIGTTWGYVDGGTAYTLSFTSQTACNMRIKSVSLSDEYYEGVFIISGSNISFTFDTWVGGYRDGKFLNDNEMTINGRVFKKNVL